ncbi:hypothetical protein EAS56_25645 [Bradyrhizobium guangzhouense]|uniref:Uncharacterized protein n=1 Tax=Bradyrhizobium guangzhouense TaxID=1325095 RepID=A0ABY0E0W5_9BRAD|nr:hypothetical protein EAS56_25645 [Bradyrhizobium guangzhouense]
MQEKVALEAPSAVVDDTLIDAYLGNGVSQAVLVEDAEQPIDNCLCVLLALGAICQRAQFA